MSSTVEEIVSTSYTPEQREKRYRTMIRAIASSRRQSVDPAIVEASGRFMVDAERDLAGARRRVQAVKEIEAARAELKRLREIIPTARPTADDPVEKYPTVGQLAMAVYAVQNPRALWGPVVDHGNAITEAEGEIKRAQSYLRSTSALEIDQRIRDCKATIERTGQAEAEREALVEKLADLKGLLDGANPRSDEQRAQVMAQRAEHAQLRKRLAGSPDVDHEAIATAEAEIEQLTASQLLPENLEFSKPSGEVQGIYPVPCRFA